MFGGVCVCGGVNFSYGGRKNSYSERKYLSRAAREPFCAVGQNLLENHTSPENFYVHRLSLNRHVSTPSYLACTVHKF